MDDTKAAIYYLRTFLDLLFLFAFVRFAKNENEKLITRDGSQRFFTVGTLAIVMAHHKREVGTGKRPSPVTKLAPLNFSLIFTFPRSTWNGWWSGKHNPETVR